MRYFFAAVASMAVLFMVFPVGARGDDGVSAVPWPPPCVTTADLVEHGTLQLMGDFTTHYPHSPADRNFNLARAAKSLCGTVVPPGGTFSFNGQVGDANFANGYKRAGVFIGDRIVQGAGGGVCQVVSTLYNAVVQAGLPTIEARRHSMAVPYLTPGQDATIAYGFIDFTFRNDTPGPILIVAAAKGPDIRAAVYGDVGGTEVSWQHDILARAKPYTVRRRVRSLPAGEVRVVDPGQEGFTVQSRYAQTGRFGERHVNRGTHWYSPRPRVVEEGVG